MKRPQQSKTEESNQRFTDCLLWLLCCCWQWQVPLAAG